MHYDITSKKIFDISIHYVFQHFLSIKPEKIELIEKLPQEIFSSHRVDYPVKIHLDHSEFIYLFEIQSFWNENKLIDLAIYNLSFFKTYQIPTKVILILLTPSPKAKNFFALENLSFYFTLIKLYEISPNLILKNHIIEMYPLVPLMDGGLNHLEQITEEIEKNLTEEKMIEIYDMLIILLGLKDKNKSKLLYEKRRKIMIESPIIDQILKEGMEKGRNEGKIEGIKEGKIEGIKQGKIEGIKEGKIEIAKRMLKKQKSLNEICELLDCTIDDLKKWKVI